jgi:hypothetical protein
MFKIQLSQLAPPVRSVQESSQTGSSSGAEITGVYPNPVQNMNGQINVRFRLDQAAPASIAVYDLLGHEERVLLNEWTAAGEQERDFNIANLASGHHFLVLTANGKTVTKALNVE